MAKNDQQNPANIIPPHNSEAENSVIGALLIEGDAIYKVADFLKPSDFYNPEMETLYGAILKLTEQRQPVDIVTLTDHLEKNNQLDSAGGASTIASLAASVSSSAHIISHANIIKNNSTMRRLISAGSKIVELGFQTEKDADWLLDSAEQTLFSISKDVVSDAFVPIQSILSETFERIDELHKNKGQLRGVPTGIPPLDNLLAGLQPSDLIILAARPSMGKTTLMLNLAVNAAKAGAPVGIFSLEQSKDQIIDRILVAEAQVDSWKLRVGKLDDSDFPRIGHAMGVLSELPIFIDDSPLNSITQMRAKARRLQAEHGLGLLVIDYLQLMEGRSSYGSDNRVQEISEISRSLKSIARELDIPVIALSQLSRAVEQRHPKIPQLADLRESGCLAGDTLIIDPSTGKQETIENITASKSSRWKSSVLTFNDKLQLDPSPITDAFSTGKKLTFELTTQSGKTIRATANHKFLTIRGWKRLDELSPIDYLATPREIQYRPSKQKLADEQLILIAHLIGDGCTLARQPIHYTNADLACHKAVATSAKKLFGIAPRQVKQENWYHTYLPSPFRLARDKRNPIAKWFSEMGIFNLRAHEKLIPAIIFEQPLPQIAIFLSHLWATDGSITKGKSNQWRIYYASNSFQLASALAHLLLRFGIIARIKKSHKKGYRTTWSVDISGTQSQLVFCQAIGVFGAKSNNVKQALAELSEIQPNTNVDIIPKDIWREIEAERRRLGWSTRKFHAEMNWAYSGTQRHNNSLSRTRLAKVATTLKSSRLEALSNSQIFWDQVKSITKHKIEKVYDLTIDKTHNFIANDIIVHNSIEQDADVVAFIYREEYYDPDTDRKGIADLMIKKHRNGPIGNVELFFKPEHMRFTAIETRRGQGAPE